MEKNCSRTFAADFENSLSKYLLELLKKQKMCKENHTPELKSLFETLGAKNNHFKHGRQADSFELFNTLLVGIFDEMDLFTKSLKVQPEAGSAIDVRRLFTGLSTRLYVFCSCKHVEVDLEKFTSLSIPMTHKTGMEKNPEAQSREELQTLMTKEPENDLERGLATLEQIEEYSECYLPCTSCNKDRTGSVYRRLLLFQPPPVLVLRIDRFTMNRFNKLSKNQGKFEYPQTLSLQEFCSVASCFTTPPKTDFIYELYAVVVHTGTINGGHYYAFVNTTRKHDIDRWHNFVCKPTESEDTLNEEVTRIFKEGKYKIEQQKDNPKITLPKVTSKWFCVTDKKVIQVEQDIALSCKDAYILFYEVQ